MMKHPLEFTDTDPRAMEVWLDLLRRMTPGERIAATLDLTSFALQMSAAGVRSSFPGADDQEVFLRVGKFTKIQSLGPEPIECAIATAEDTILRKLEWYRAGGETSERQWNDLRGVLAVSGAQLDREYLHEWATHLKVDDLLDRLLAE